MKRLSAREFRTSFHKLDEPVLVGKGVWYPDIGLVGTISFDVEEAHVEGEVRVIDKVRVTGSALRAKPRFILTKEAQVKGRTRT